MTDRPFDPWTSPNTRIALVGEPDYAPLRAPAVRDDAVTPSVRPDWLYGETPTVPDDESPQEELARLRRELSELDPETVEHASTLDRIAVLVRELAERRRVERRAVAPTDTAPMSLLLAHGFRALGVCAVCLDRGCEF